MFCSTPDCEDPATSIVMVETRGTSDHVCERHKGERVAELEAALVPYTLISTYAAPPTANQTIEYLRAMLGRSEPELRAELGRSQALADTRLEQIKALGLEVQRLEGALANAVDRCTDLNSELETVRAELAAQANAGPLPELREALEASRKRVAELEAELGARLDQ